MHDAFAENQSDRFHALPKLLLRRQELIETRGESRVFTAIANRKPNRETNVYGGTAKQIRFECGGSRIGGATPEHACLRAVPAFAVALGTPPPSSRAPGSRAAGTHQRASHH